MKKYSYIGISFVLLIFGIWFVPRIVNRLDSNTVVHNDRMSADNPVTNEKLAYIKINGSPKKTPDFAFLNQDSIIITNHDFKGKVYVVGFFFTSCPTICPIMTKNLGHLQQEFANEDHFGIASFTIDPERDTPKKMKEYAERYKATHPNWHFLTGDQTDLYTLANTGFNIYTAERPDVPGGFEHSGFFALIDQEGYIRSRYDAAGNPIIYYRGTVTPAEGKNDQGEEEQISILIDDIKKLLTST